MNKITLQNLTPDIYYNQSRDFQFIGRLFDVVLNSVKVNADKLYNNPISYNSDEKLIDYIVSILTVTRPENHKNQGRSVVSSNKSNDITRYIQFGASPRAGIAMLKCAKVHAMFEGREFVLPEDIKAVAMNVLRHRIILSYEAAADNVTADEIIARILDFIPVP